MIIRIVGSDCRMAMRPIAKSEEKPYISIFKVAGETRAIENHGGPRQRHGGDSSPIEPGREEPRKRGSGQPY